MVDEQGAANFSAEELVSTDILFSEREAYVP
jgi:hypothetical protein